MNDVGYKALSLILGLATFFAVGTVHANDDLSTATSPAIYEGFEFSRTITFAPGQRSVALVNKDLNSNLQCTLTASGVVANAQLEIPSGTRVSILAPLVNSENRDPSIYLVNSETKEHLMSATCTERSFPTFLFLGKYRPTPWALEVTAGLTMKRPLASLPYRSNSKSVEGATVALHFKRDVVLSTNRTFNKKFAGSSYSGGNYSCFTSTNLLPPLSQLVVSGGSTLYGTVRDGVVFLREPLFVGEPQRETRLVCKKWGVYTANDQVTTDEFNSVVQDFLGAEVEIIPVQKKIIR